MRSTDSAHSLTIEFRRASVVAFWVLGVATVFLAVGAARTAMGATAPWQLGAWIVAALLLPGLVWRPWFEKGIWAWNGSMRILALLLSKYILRVSYFLLLAPLGVSYSSLDLSSPLPHRSRWIERRRGSDGPASARQASAYQPGLRHGLDAFVRTPGNRWAVSLLPLVFLLALLRDERQEATPPANTYTLY